MRRLEVFARELVASLMAGRHRSVFRGQGMEFDEVREYVAGDDVRLIDWNVTSRMGTAFTKLFREQRELNLALLVDVSASMLHASAGKRELAARVVAILALAVERTGDLVSAYLFSDRLERWLPARRGRGHVLRLIEQVVAVQPRGQGSDLALALRTAAATLHRRRTCVLISDFKTDGFWPQLGVLARHHEVLALRIADEYDTSFPPAGCMELRDPETGRVIYADAASHRFRAAYREHAEQHLATLRSRCRQHNVDLVEIAVGDDPAAVLARFFRRKGRLRRA